MSYKGPIAKKSRALGIPLTQKAAAIMEKRPAPPGQHGARRKSKSDYGLQLLEKQRLKFQYDLKEYQLKKYFKNAVRLKGSTSEKLLELLERRLDILVHRAGFASTVYMARQLVRHGHFQLNGKNVNFPGIKVGNEDIVGLREKSKTLQVVKESLARTTRAPYVDIDLERMECKFNKVPEGHEIPVVCNTQAVTEYYSR